MGFTRPPLYTPGFQSAASPTEMPCPDCPAAKISAYFVKHDPLVSDLKKASASSRARSCNRFFSNPATTLTEDAAHD